MRYSDVEAFTRAALVALHYGEPGHPTMPLIDPGPPTIARLQSKSPSGMLFLTLGNGIGPAKEGLFDLPFIVVRVVGRQNDFDYAENLAYDVDHIFLAVESNTLVGTAKTLYINRTGGAPQLVDCDAGERYHFQTTYITEAQR